MMKISVIFALLCHDIVSGKFKRYFKRGQGCSSVAQALSDKHEVQSLIPDQKILSKIRLRSLVVSSGDCDSSQGRAYGQQNFL